MNGVSLVPRASDATMLYRTSGQRISDDSLAMAERDVLTREQALKASVNGSSHTTYKYEIAPDGKRYIVGAEVSILASEDELDSVPGIKTMKTSQKPAKAEAGNEGGKPVSARDPNDAEAARLEQTEREVISHENAHKGAAGQFGGPVHYTYTTGPDGRRYITGGEVPIHTPATNDPEEALRNAAQVMRAALAPGDPSGQDIAAAASAAAIASEARARIVSGEGDGNNPSSVSAANREAIGRSYSNSRSPKGLWSKNFGFEASWDSSDRFGTPVFGSPILDIPA